MGIQDVPDKVISRIQKLLALAADPNNEHEAAQAAARAQELLFKHKLSASQVKDAGNNDDKFGGIKLRFSSIRAIPRWKRSLAATLSKYNFCKAFFGSSKDVGAILTFLGEADDVQTCAVLFAYLTAELEKLSDAGWRSRLNTLTKSGVHYSLRDGVTWKNSFYMGAVEVVSSRMAAMRRQNLLEAGEPGLVLVTKSMQQLNTFLEKVFGKIPEEKQPSKKAKKSKVDFDGYFKGMRAGQDLSLNDPTVSKLEE